jgi:ABC-type dipeptide/oligopeptide/nickel transport system ATPase component
MKTIQIKDCKIIPPKGNAFSINTSKHMMKMHQCMLVCGKRGSGKSVAITSYLSMLKKEGKMDRIFVISPTFDSNKKLMKSLDIQDEDVYAPDENYVIEDIIEKVNEERDDYLKYWEDLKRFKELQKQIKNKNIYIDDIDADLLIDFIVDGELKAPTHKWSGRKPVLSLFIDDSQSTQLFRTPKFLNLITRHRHIGAFPEGSALGLSVYTAIQNYTSQHGGCPRVLRNNCTSLLVFKMKDKKELEQIFQSVAGEISEDDFHGAFEYATNEPHSFLLIDFHKKDHQPSCFRKRFDEYIIVNSDKNENNISNNKSNT